MDKAPDAYRTISEVADELDLPQHVLRFWETRFAQIRPLKRGGGRRYYRPDDIDLLRGIRHLLYGQGYTIRGVQRIIKESGVKAIQALGRGEGLAAPAKPGGPEVVAQPEPARERLAEAPRGGLTAGLRGLFSGAAQSPVRTEPALGWSRDEASESPLAAEPAASGFDDRFEPEEDSEPLQAAPVAAPLPAAQAASVVTEPASDRPTPSAGLPGNGHGPREAPPSVAAARPAEPTARGQTLRFAPAVLAPEDVRRLQAALYELTECRRRLDDVLEGA